MCLVILEEYYLWKNVKLIISFENYYFMVYHSHVQTSSCCQDMAIKLLHFFALTNKFKTEQIETTILDGSY